MRRTHPTQPRALTDGGEQMQWNLLPPPTVTARAGQGTSPGSHGCRDSAPSSVCLQRPRLQPRAACPQRSAWSGRQRIDLCGEKRCVRPLERLMDEPLPKCLPPVYEVTREFCPAFNDSLLTRSALSMEAEIAPLPAHEKAQRAGSHCSLPSEDRIPITRELTSPSPRYRAQ